MTVNINSEKALGIYVLGVISALENGLITPEESEAALFRPYICDELKKLKVNYHLQSVVSRGLETDDVYRLAPEGYEGLIRGMREECKKYFSESAAPGYPVGRYFDFNDKGAVNKFGENK